MHCKKNTPSRLTWRGEYCIIGGANEGANEKMIGINRGAEKGQKVCETVLCGVVDGSGNALK